MQKEQFLHPKCEGYDDQKKGTREVEKTTNQQIKIPAHTGKGPSVGDVAGAEVGESTLA